MLAIEKHAQIGTCGQRYTDTNELIPAMIIKDTVPAELMRYAEHQRLKDAVVEAGRLWRRAQGDAQHVTEVDGLRLMVVRAWFLLRKAIDALNEFEAESES